MELNKTERIITSYLLLTKIPFNANTFFNRFSCIFGAAVAVVIVVANAFLQQSCDKFAKEDSNGLKDIQISLRHIYKIYRAYC